MSQERAYGEKRREYYDGVNRRLLDRLSLDPRRSILEVGCGAGNNGVYAKESGRCGRYVGVEINPAAAVIAADRLDAIHVLDVESASPPFEDASFDVLVASEVLEHLVDPWTFLKQYKRYLRPGGLVFASSPNVANISTLAMLLNGRWDLEASGRMDRTHLRWFTPRSFRAMFEEGGYEVLAVTALTQPGIKTRLFNRLTLGSFAHLFVSQIVIEARVWQATAANASV
jgi:SAM-dependent methyltransferase